MASGKTHEAINIAAFSVITTGYAVARVNGVSLSLSGEVLTGFVVAYLVGTFLATPDMDLAEEKRVQPKARWGRLGFLWVPYGRMFEHRGLSHSWLFGPFTRLIYLAAIILGFEWLMARFLALVDLPPIFFVQNIDNREGLLLGILVGYYLSQWFHLIVDGVKPNHGRSLSRNKRR